MKLLVTGGCGFISLAVTNALGGKPIRVYGDGINVRDWLWVTDHCRGIELAFRKRKAGGTQKTVDGGSR